MYASVWSKCKDNRYSFMKYTLIQLKAVLSMLLLQQTMSKTNNGPNFMIFFKPVATTISCDIKYIFLYKNQFDTIAAYKKLFRIYLIFLSI